MAYLLHIESTSTVCSVAISENEKLLALKEINDGFTHAENLHFFIKAALVEASLKIEQLQGISISSGPGSYTGLRIGFSSAKGLAYALKIPLIKVDTLQAFSKSVIDLIHLDAFYCPLIDARRMEVYFAIHTKELFERQKPSNLIMNAENAEVFKLDKDIYFFGDGLDKSKPILNQIKGGHFIENFKPSAKYLISLAYKKYSLKYFEDLAYSEPLYLKEFFFAKSSDVKL